MRPLTSFLAISSFLLSASSILVSAQNEPFNKNNDNYPFKTEISNGIHKNILKNTLFLILSIATLNGFTIEYKNYYKILTNTISNKRYCLLGFNQTLAPEGCATESTIRVPVKNFDIDPDSYAVVPFIEVCI
jgi:hypothetical protein